MTETTGLYFVGEAIADQRPDPEDPRRMLVALGGSMYFGCMGAASAIRNRGLTAADSFYVGPVSDDYFGGLIRDDFEKAGVKTDYVRSSPFISMIAVISEDGKGGNKYSFYGRNQMNTTEHLQLDQLPSAFREEKKIFTFGSVATTLSQSGKTLKEFAKIQAAQGAVILFDPNTRPSVIPDVAAYRAALEEWIQTASVVKASEEDITFTYPDKTAGQLAAHWLSLGAQAVFITRGEKGCNVYHRDQSAYIESTISPFIRRTVGAGDNFNAGIVVALAEKGVTTLSQLSSLTIEDWQDIAMTANTVAYQHLLRVNHVSEPQTLKTGAEKHG